MILFLISGLACAFTRATYSGESDDYMIASVSIQEHASLDIRSGDIDQLEKEFPKGLERVREVFEAGRYVRDVYGKQYPYYMGTYSISVLPVKIVAKFFNLPQTYVFHISNVLDYFLALLVVYFYFYQTREKVFLTILLLVCSTSFFYISWASAEFFICSLMIVSLVFYTNGNRYLAALFTSIAATLNITICAFGLIMIVDYLIAEYKLKEKETVSTVIRRNWKKTMGLAICFTPFLITPLWNLYHYHKITPQINMAQYDAFWLRRFVAYLFDLNFGFLPYFPILLILFFAVVIAGICKKERMTIMLALGFFAVVFLYSAMGHINCGMTAMARYNVWTLPFLVITVVSQYDRLFKKIRTQNIIATLLVVSACITFASTIAFMWYRSGDNGYFTPVAKFFLDKSPALYNPYPFTFISRLRHVDGGYDYNATLPFIYFSDDGIARKILIPPKCNDPMEFFNFSLSAEKNDMSRFAQQVRSVMANRSVADWTYLNIAPGMNITMKRDEITDYLPKLDNPNYLVMVSVRDEASSKINDEIARELSGLGLRKDLRGKYCQSYIAVIDSGSVVYEDLQNARIKYAEVFDDVSLEVVSAGFEVGNVSEIKINGSNYSKNSRGLNIVIYNKKEKAVVDSVAFDTFDRLQCVR
jgi:hypothetical protein